VDHDETRGLVLADCSTVVAGLVKLVFLRSRKRWPRTELWSCSRERDAIVGLVFAREGFLDWRSLSNLTMVVGRSRGFRLTCEAKWSSAPGDGALASKWNAVPFDIVVFIWTWKVFHDMAESLVESFVRSSECDIVKFGNQGLPC
jgi:hypothetical protein